MPELPDGYEQFGGSYLQPEWVAKEGNDKNLEGSVSPSTVLQKIIDYTVPAGKALIIDHFGLMVRTTDERNVAGYIYDATDGEILAVHGGAGGAGLVLNKPAVIEAGHKAQLWGTATTTTGTLYGHMGGYEI